jgi:hypothetical protein
LPGQPMNPTTATTAHLSHVPSSSSTLLQTSRHAVRQAGLEARQGRSVAPISLTRLPARRRTRLRRAVRLSPSVSPSSFSLCPLIARRRWCRELCAGAGGGRGAAGGGAGRSAAWAASGGRRAASRVVERRALCRRRRSDRGVASSFLFPSLPIPLRLLGVFVFGPDHDFTNSIVLHVLCWVRPCLQDGVV